MAPSQATAKTVTINIPPPPNEPPALVEFKAAAAKDASNWNHLLRWHRRNRGPQWDYSTAMYHVDQGSASYYGGVELAEEDNQDDSSSDDSEGPALKRPRRQASSRPGVAGSPEEAREPIQQHETSKEEARPTSGTTPSNGPIALPPMPAHGSTPHQLPVNQSPATHMNPLPNASPQQGIAASLTPEARQQYERMFQQAAKLKMQQQQQQQQQPPKRPGSGGLSQAPPPLSQGGIHNPYGSDIGSGHMSVAFPGFQQMPPSGIPPQALPQHSPPSN